MFTIIIIMSPASTGYPSCSSSLMRYLELQCWPLETDQSPVYHSSFEVKKLLNNSSWDFEHVLDTMDDSELVQIKIFAQKVLQPGGAAIILPKSGRNQILTLL